MGKSIEDGNENLFWVAFNDFQKFLKVFGEKKNRFYLYFSGNLMKFLLA